MIDDTYSSGRIIPSQNMELEKKVEQKLVTLVNEKGGTAYKFTSPQRRSVPDRIVIMPGGKIYFVEVKRVGARARKAQEREIARLRELGCDVYVLAGTEEVKKFVSEVL